MTLGLKHGENRLRAYSDEWPGLYSAESCKIQNVCGELLIAIQHVGSTAVPGLTSKPIIDIPVGVETLSTAEKMIPGMETIGYDYPGDNGIPDDRIFGRDRHCRLFLVHVVVFQCDRWNNYRKFRDAVRANKLLATEYANIKEAIVKKHPVGRGTYPELKQEFIHRVLHQSH